MDGVQFGPELFLNTIFIKSCKLTQNQFPVQEFETFKISESMDENYNTVD
jgi:hypothetical protein